MADKPTLTTTAGAPIPDNQNSLTAGSRGPVLLQDYQLIEKLAHQNRERIPERVVHAKGWGAHGTFTVTHDITRYTKAIVFSEVGKKTEIISRFSTVAGEIGAADAERDVRGFSTKFYTEQGNWDLAGNNTPVFFVRDPLKFPDFIRTQKRHPRTHLRSPTAMWDFWSLSPESLHQVTTLFSDRGLPVAPMYMNGYGSHTYSFLNAQNERHWVKFHFKTLQGHRHYTNREGEAVIAKDRESYQRELFGAIEEGRFPKWRLFVQIMPELDAEKTPYNPFDLTKVWPHGDYPLIEVGILELNRNADNYFAEIEQLAFSPSNIVPGIGFSPDKMLQARIFSYADAHRVARVLIEVVLRQDPAQIHANPGADHNDDECGDRDGQCMQCRFPCAKASDEAQVHCIGSSGVKCDEAHSPADGGRRRCHLADSRASRRAWYDFPAISGAVCLCCRAPV